MALTTARSVVDDMREVAHALSRVVAGLDPAGLVPDQAAGVLEHAVRVEKLAAGLKLLVADHAASSAAWKKAGEPSADRWMARMAGTSIGDAGSLITTSARLASQPEVQEAVRAGSLSTKQAVEVAGAVAVDPMASGVLLDAARTDLLGALKEKAAEVRAAADPDPEATQRRHHKTRSFRSGTATDGSWWASLRGPMAAGVELLAGLKPFIEQAFRDAKEDGRRESTEAYEFDAMLAMARASAACGSDERRPRTAPFKGIIRIDHAALVRGSAEPGETCDVAGVGPVPVSSVRDWIETGDVFLTAILTKGHDVHAVAHLGRKPTSHQRTALEWQYDQCRVEGCNSRRAIQIDHVKPWAETHQTFLPELQWLCPHHHRQKTAGFVAVESEQTGFIRLTPPEEASAASRAGPPGA